MLSSLLITARSEVLTIMTLSKKSIRQIYRSSSLRSMFVMSSLLLFSIFFCIYCSSQGKTLAYSSNKPYDNLSFDIECNASAIAGVRCQPFNNEAKDQSASPMTTTDVLFDFLISGKNGFQPISNASGDDVQVAHNLVGLLSSIMMNGFPILGIDDYVLLSDIVNKQLGADGKQLIMDYVGYRDRFGNFLDVKNRQLRFVGKNCLTYNMLQHWQKHNVLLKELNIATYDNMNDAISADGGVANVLAIIELSPDPAEDTVMSRGFTDTYNGEYAPFVTSNISMAAQRFDYLRASFDYNMDTTTCSKFVKENAVLGRDGNKEEEGDFDGSFLRPLLMRVRMHPSAIPDTRNFQFSPMKNNAGTPRLASGQLLYFISGFLTLQLETQNFLSSQGLGGPIIRTQLLHDDNTFQYPEIDERLLATMSTTSDPDVAQNVIYELLEAYREKPPTMNVPIYHRAFPTHRYEQDLYWHAYGTLITIAFIVYICLPAAVTSGACQREFEDGTLDVLSTVGVRCYHNGLAWLLSSVLWSTLSTVPCALLLAVTCKYTQWYFPSIGVLLCGFSLSSLALLLGIYISKPDKLVLTIPTMAFITAIPGLLYFELAFDVQRSTLNECIICLLPSSALALLLRNLCGQEALQAALTMDSKADVSNTKMEMYLYMLLFDFCIYTACAVEAMRRCDNKRLQVQWKHREDAYRLEHQERENESLPGIQKVFQAAFGFLSNNSTSLHSQTSINNYGSVLQEEVLASDKDIALSCKDISMSYSPELPPVLDKISARLYQSQVTILMGSNGAGKTTLMQILAGLLGSFTGAVTYLPEAYNSVWHSTHHSPLSQVVNKKRMIGWCPQKDTLFDYLTVYEHLELYAQLLNPLNWEGNFAYRSLSSLDEEKKDRSWSFDSTMSFKHQSRSVLDQDIQEALERLNMREHADKLSSCISGGMKRRLALCLAFAGNPAILLLDEATSGCDSHTRELIRKDILSRKQDCAIIMSTHHVDDVEVLGDRLWFLDDCDLSFDGTLKELFQESGKKTSQQQPEDDNNDDDVEFTTADAFIDSMFRSHFDDGRVPYLQVGNTRIGRSPQRNPIENDSDASASNDTSASTVSIFRVTGTAAVHHLRQFITTMEDLGHQNWSLATFSTYRALTHLFEKYQPAVNTPENNESAEASSHTCFDHLNRFLTQFLVIVQMRWLHMCSIFSSFLALNVLMPFLLVLAIGIGCRDVRYPVVELTSVQLGGTGEVVVGYNTDLFTVESNGSTSIHMTGNTTNRDRELLFHREGEMIPSLRGNSSVENASTFNQLTENVLYHGFTWLPNYDSNAVWTYLFDTFYSHPQRQRWGAFVMKDEVANWVVVNVIVKASSLDMDIKQTFMLLKAAYTKVCGMYENSTDTNDDNQRQEEGTVDTVPRCQALQSLSLSLIMVNRNSSDMAHQNESQSMYTPTSTDGSDVRNNRTEPELAIKLSMTAAMNSNLSMLTNVTTDHAAPVLLKEVAPILYTLIQEQSLLQNPPETAPRYRIVSDPLEEVNYTNSVYIERGYLGGMMILMYILITTISSVNFVITMKRCGAKKQLQLSGMTSLAYWIGNFLLDSMLVFLTLVAIGGAIYCGSEPVSGYFSLPHLPQFNSMVYVQSTLAFSMAIVASNYAWCVSSTDHLSSQLKSLIATVSIGIFLRMYLERHPEYPFSLVCITLYYISPAFTFTTCMFELFQSHAKEMLSVSVQAIVDADITKGLDPSMIMRHIESAVSRDYNSYSFLMKSAQDVNVSINILCLQAALYISIAMILDHSHVQITRNRYTAYTICVQVYKRFYKMYNAICTHCSGLFGEQDTTATNLSRDSSYSSLQSTEHGIELQPVLSSHGGDDGKEDTTLLEIQDLNVHYGKEKALQLLNLSLDYGEHVALLGMNGSGKSTLFRVLAEPEELRQYTGIIKLAGMDANTSHQTIHTGRVTGYVPQEGGLMDFLTVQQSLSLYSTLLGRTYTRDSYVEVLLEKYNRHQVSALSGGNKKKLSLILANMAQPSLLLLDECTTGLDPLAGQTALNYLKSCSSNRQGMLFSSHRIDECLQICTRIIMMHKGKLIFDGSASLFDRLACEFFQVDVYMQCPLEHLIDSMERQCHALHSSVCANTKADGREDGDHNERFVYRVTEYSSELSRLTYAKQRIRLSTIWTILSSLMDTGDIKKYAFRILDTEEALSAIIEGELLSEKE